MHLGSIAITRAQITRQQRAGTSQSVDEDNEYRHALLIVEAKRNPLVSNSQHVLCAESDADRDSWVDVLVRYADGYYDNQQTLPSLPSIGLGSVQPHSSTSSVGYPEQTNQQWGYLKDWLDRHSDHPYASEDEKKQLCQATGLSMSQLSNWMINVCHLYPLLFLAVV